MNTIEQIRASVNPELELEGILRTMFDPRNNLSNEVSAQLLMHFGDKVFRTVIPRNVRLAEAPSFGKAVLYHDRESRGALAYLALAGEMIRREEEEAMAIGSRRCPMRPENHSAFPRRPPIQPRFLSRLLSPSRRSPLAVRRPIRYTARHGHKTPQSRPRARSAAGWQHGRVPRGHRLRGTSGAARRGGTRPNPGRPAAARPLSAAPRHAAGEPAGARGLDSRPGRRAADRRPAARGGPAG